MEAAILDQLTQIEWLIATLIVGVLLISAVRAWARYTESGGVRGLMRRSFFERARGFREDGRFAELLQLSAERCKSEPGDAWRCPERC
jgi:hypothetical protein